MAVELLASSQRQVGTCVQGRVCLQHTAGQCQHHAAPASSNFALCAAMACGSRVTVLAPAAAAAPRAVTGFQWCHPV